MALEEQLFRFRRGGELGPSPSSRLSRNFASSSGAPLVEVDAFFAKLLRVLGVLDLVDRGVVQRQAVHRDGP